MVGATMILSSVSTPRTSLSSPDLGKTPIETSLFFYCTLKVLLNATSRKGIFIIIINLLIWSMHRIVSHFKIENLVPNIAILIEHYAANYVVTQSNLKL